MLYFDTSNFIIIIIYNIFNMMTTSCSYGNRVSLLLVKKVKVDASTQTDEIKTNKNIVLINMFININAKILMLLLIILRPAFYSI